MMALLELARRATTGAVTRPAGSCKMPSQVHSALLDGIRRWRLESAALVLAVAASLATSGRCDDISLPVGSAPAPLAAPHFPDRLHALVWRNWQLVEPQRIAEAVGTTADKIESIATSMGLPPTKEVSPEWGRRGYITIVRRNWHLVPYEQLLTLVDMSAAELAEALREDDFLYVKLGLLKPKCDPIRYEPPGEAARARAAEIAALVREHFGTEVLAPVDPPFGFIARLSEAPPGLDAPPGAGETRGDEGPRYIYSYFGVFGDPLSDASLDPYPDGLLARLAENGINGVWLHVMLRQLAPGGEHFPEFGEGHEKRLKNLRGLVERAKRHGISVYLYINEPRAMPTAFFAGREEAGGVTSGDFRTLCTSDPRVRAWLGDSLEYVFRAVPDLGGVFTITASENLTSCASHGGQAACPRCRERSGDEIIAEVNQVIRDGVRRASPTARVIVWDWGWNGHGIAPGIIARLPDDVWLQSVSEWSLPIERGGVATSIGEYSISAVGPGPRAKEEWRLARERGLKTSAKVQFNITWELAAVPYLPALELVAEHAARLGAEEVDGMMLSWSLGGYPSPNLRIAQRFAESPESTVDGVLEELATELYGEAGAPHARRAWHAFSRAFREYPYSGALVYNGPQQMGPANLLFIEPTGYRSTMVGFPYDDLDGWRGPYPAEVLHGQLRKVADGWRDGIAHLEAAVAAAPPERKGAAEDDLRVAKGGACHFASAANQARFILLRGKYLGEDATVEERKEARREMMHLIDEEIRLARELHALVRRDSRIGFEASNHYFYVANDLMEKVLSCELLRRGFKATVSE